MTAPEKTPSQQLATPVQFVPGVGPHRAELLEKLGLRTAADVLFFFPRDYQDLTQVRPVVELEEGKLQSVQAAWSRNSSFGRRAPDAASSAC